MSADRMAWASLVLALAAAALTVLLLLTRGPAYVGIVPGAIAVIFGVSASRQSSRVGTERPLTALVGLIVGALITTAVTLWFAGLVLLFLLCAPASEC